MSSIIRVWARSAPVHRALVLTVAATAAWGGAARAQTVVRRAASVPGRATADRLIGRADARDTLPMSITLRLQHTRALQGLLKALQDPGAPAYHHWLTPEQFRQQFAPPASQYEAVATWLERQGFSVHRSDDRMRLAFGGAVATVERAFGVRMNYYRHGGRRRLANENAPRLPVSLAAAIAVVRLDTFPLARPLVRVIQAGSATDTMAVADVQRAYDALPLLESGIDGSGQTVAVVARSDFLLSDVAQFQQQFGTTVRAPVKVFPGGNPGIGSANDICAGIRSGFRRQQCIQGEEGEVVLDAEWADALAPGATVLVDISDADIDQSLSDIVTHHPEAKIISISFGDCERLNPSDRTVFGPLYAQAAAQGQTVLVASGDNGVDDCGDGLGASTDVLASDVNVTAVGGTALDPGFDATGQATGHVRETVWNDASGASGGGPSVLVAKPSYQQALGVPDDGARDVPDVAILASPLTAGYASVVEGAVTIVGGTSAAVPAWAGIIALLNEARGLTGAGAVNDALYAVGRQQYAAAAAGPFFDITSGDNRFDGLAGYSAGVGYDLVTGLGAPDVALLAQALAATQTPTAPPSFTPRPTASLNPTATPVPPATATPSAASAACVGDCTGERAVFVTDILTLVDIVLGAAQSAACPHGIPRGAAVDVTLVIQAVHNALSTCPAT